LGDCHTIFGGSGGLLEYPSIAFSALEGGYAGAQYSGKHIAGTHCTYKGFLG